MKVAVIGAGASGLTAIKILLEFGNEVTCYEKASDLGGVWSRDPISRRVYDSTLMTSSKYITSFSDFPPDSNLPHFLTHSQYLSYLEAYASEFSLTDYIQFSTTVTNLAQRDHQWSLATLKGRQETEHWFDAIAVCSGLHQLPFIPDIAGLASFKGTIMHSANYRHPEPFRNQRVAIVGVRESASAIAKEISSVTQTLFLATDNGTWVVPRYGETGYPQDYFTTRARFTMPRSVYSLVEPTMFRLFWKGRLVNEQWRNRDYWHWHYKLASSAKTTFHSGYLTKCDDLIEALRDTGLTLVPRIKSFTESAVILNDNSSLEIDSILFCTGYKPYIPFLNMEMRSERLALNVLHMDFPTLAFIGFSRPNLGAIPPIAEMQSRWFASSLSGPQCIPPSNTYAHTQSANDESGREVVNTKMVEWVPYMRELAKHANCEPHLLHLFFTDPLLALKVLLGPFTSHQFRLRGPGQQYHKARRIILTLPIMHFTTKYILPLYILTFIPSQLMQLCRTTWKRLVGSHSA